MYFQKHISFFVEKSFVEEMLIFCFIIVDKLTHTTCYIVTYFLCLRQKHLIQKNVCSSVLCFFLNIVRCRIKEMILFWSLISNMITTHPGPRPPKKKSSQFKTITVSSLLQVWKGWWYAVLWVVTPYRLTLVYWRMWSWWEDALKHIVRHLNLKIIQFIIYEGKHKWKTKLFRINWFYFYELGWKCFPFSITAIVNWT